MLLDDCRFVTRRVAPCRLDGPVREEKGNRKEKTLHLMVPFLPVAKTVTLQRAFRPRGVRQYAPNPSHAV